MSESNLQLENVVVETEAQQVIKSAKAKEYLNNDGLWSSVGLCNGATGTVVDFIFQNDHRPPALPIAVIVMFEDYRGPSFSENIVLLCH